MPIRHSPHNNSFYQRSFFENFEKQPGSAGLDRLIGSHHSVLAPAQGPL